MIFKILWSICLGYKKEKQQEAHLHFLTHRHSNKKPTKSIIDYSIELFYMKQTSVRLTRLFLLRPF